MQVQQLLNFLLEHCRDSCKVQVPQAGFFCSRFLLNILPLVLYLFQEIIFIYECSPSKALLEAFVKTDIAFRKELDSSRKSKRVIQKDWHPGCTAVAALIVRNKLFVANAGDCRTILCRAGQPFVLTRVSWDLFHWLFWFTIRCSCSQSHLLLKCQDHVASCLKERERVVSAGGQVKWQVDTWRVGPAALQVFLFNLYDHSITMLSSKNTGSMLIINPKKWSMLLSSTIAYCGKLDNILLFFWQLFFLLPRFYMHLLQYS